MADAYGLAMVSLGYIFLFTDRGKVSCSQFCSPVTENGWFSVDPANTVCFKHYKKASTWWDAKRACEQEGLFLVRPDSESINKFIDKFRHYWPGFEFWIGGINQEDSGWKWTNGDKMYYTDFEFFSGTLSGILSFFKKSTLCAMHGYSGWLKKNCDELAPYLCQSGRNATLMVEPHGSMPRTRFSDSSTKFCDQESVTTRGTACFVFFEDRLTWWTANKTCHEHNMTLVIVRDRTMNEFITEVLDYTVIGFWIGAINKDDTGWKWGNGEDMLYTDFNTAIVTVDRLFKKTLCGALGTGGQFLYGWGKYACDSSYPFVCELPQNSGATSPEKLKISEQTTSPARNSGATTPEKFEISEQSTSPARNSRATPPEKFERGEQTTSPGTRKARAEIRKESTQKIFKVKKVVGGQLNPKLVNAGLKKRLTFDILSCCRLCSSEFGCGFVNFCEKSRSCVLYGNFESSVRGGVSSERGCSVYVAANKVK